MPTTTVNNLTLPDSAKAPVVHEDLFKAFEALLAAGGPLQFFASNTDRATAYTKLGFSPPVGIQCFRADAGVYERFNGTGSPALAASWTMTTPYRRTQVLTGTTASVSFTIPATITAHRIRIVWAARSDAGGFQAQQMRMRFNSDAGNNYNWQFTQGSAAAAIGSQGLSQSFASCGLQLVSTAPAGVFAAGTVDITGWDAPAGHTSNLVWNFINSAISVGTSTWAISGGGIYTPAGPYTTISFLPESGSWVAGSSFALEAWDQGL